MSIRRKDFRALVYALSLLGLAPLLKGQASDWKQIQKPPLHAFRPQMPIRIALPNGMVLFLQEDHELPLIRGTATVRGGSRDEPADKVGLVEIYGTAWRTGGTKSKTGDELDDYLEGRAAKVETSGDRDSTAVTWDCLKENFDDVFKVFLEVLREPEFREDKITLAKTQLNTSISRRNDNPFQIAFREAAKLVYGPDSSYARVPEYATVAALTREDLVNWHRAHVHSNNIILGVAGDFDSKSMEAKLREAFGSWPKGPAVPKSQASFHGPKPGVYFVPKDDVNESTVQMVDLGTTRDNPDYYAIEVFNEFFGGSFFSRLFSNIRSKKGLAYAVGGGIGTEFDHPGVLRLFLGTKSSTTAAATDAFNEELEALKTSPATPEELAKAKDAILNSFIFRFDSKEKVLRERMAYEFYNYPPDFLDRYRAGIEKATAEDIARVVSRYVHKDKMAILVVGKASDFDRPLSSFGPVTTIDVTIPSPTPTKAKAAAGSNAEGKALLARVAAAIGGEERLRSVRSLRQKISIQAQTPQGEMSFTGEQVFVFPDRMWQKLQLPMGEMTMIVSPQGAFMATPMGTQDMPASRKEDLLKELRRKPPYVIQHRDDPKFTFSAGGTEKVGDIETKVLDVNADGAEVRWFVDPQTGRILRSVYQGVGMGGPGEKIVDFSDWKTVEGISFPFKQTGTLNGQKESSLEIQEIQINPEVEPKLFEKPAGQTGGKANP